MNLDFLSDTVMIFGHEVTIGTVILSILTLLAIALLLSLNIVGLSKKKRKKNEPDDGSSMRPLDIAPSVVSSPPEPQNIEEMYAQSNGLLVCPFCETLNAKGNTRCCACGSSLPK